jgi:molecular chaperone GrpE
MSEHETQDRVETDVDELKAVTAPEVVEESGETAPEEASVDEEQAEDELAAARAEAASNYDRYLRAAAELDNYRKRTVRMRSEAREDTLRDVLLQIAPILDNLRRALGQETQDAAALKEGVELISGQFNEVLKGYGLAEIEAQGQPFDPNLHEALAEVPSDDHPPGTVMEETEKGYILNSKVVRPSRVVVSRASEEN